MELLTTETRAHVMLWHKDWHLSLQHFAHCWTNLPMLPAKFRRTYKDKECLQKSLVPHLDLEKIYTGLVVSFRIVLNITQQLLSYKGLNLKYCGTIWNKSARGRCHVLETSCYGNVFGMRYLHSPEIKRKKMKAPFHTEECRTLGI